MISEGYKSAYQQGYSDAMRDFRKEPKTGRWIDTGSGQECSNCHEIQYGYDNLRLYCANCGSRNVATTTTALQGRK